MHLFSTAIASLAALGACSSSNLVVAPADLVGPFDITKHTYDLAEVFPEGTITLEHDEGKPDSVVVEEHRFRVATIQLHDGKPTIASIRISFDVSRARFEEAHPGARCNSATDPSPLVCTSGQYPNREFILGPDRTTMIGIVWEPPAGTTYELTNLGSLKSRPAEAAATRMVGPFDLAATSFDLEKLYPDQNVFYDNNEVIVQDQDSRKALVSLELVPQTKAVKELVLHQSRAFAELAKTHPDAVCSGDPHKGTSCWRPKEPDVTYAIAQPVLDGPFVEVPIARVSGTMVAFVTWTPTKSATVILGQNTMPRTDRVPPAQLDRCVRVLAKTSACGYFYDPELGFSKDATRGRVLDIHGECDVLPVEDGEVRILPVPDYSESVVVAIESAHAKGCKQLRAELRKHTLVNEKGPV